MRPAELVAVGLDHTTAGIGLRERLAFTDAEIPAALRQLAGPAEAALEQAAILSTCNRVELYAVARARPSPEELTAWLARCHGLEPDELSGAMYFVRAGEVAYHLLIGAGDVGELAARQLVRCSVGELLVLGRDGARAGRLAERYGARAVSSERLGEALARSDVVISSTGAPRPILCRGELAPALQRRGAGAPRPLLLIDLAVPRDVDPAVSSLDGVELHTIDDLRRVVQGAVARRRAELPAACAILRGEVARFTRWLNAREGMTACRKVDR